MWLFKVRLMHNEITVEVRIEFDLSLTMINGKAANAITNNTSTRSCNICNASPTQMNHKEVLKTLESDPENLKYGLSALHAYIRCFECILHISYRLPIKKWQIRQQDEKKCLARKQRVQSKFWNELGLLVDFPKDGGAGVYKDILIYLIKIYLTSRVIKLVKYIKIYLTSFITFLYIFP